jgi:hypothetical protein
MITITDTIDDDRIANRVSGACAYELPMQVGILQAAA